MLDIQLQIEQLNGSTPIWEKAFRWNFRLDLVNDAWNASIQHLYETQMFLEICLSFFFHSAKDVFDTRKKNVPCQVR